MAGKARSFHEWKAWAAAKLIEIAQKYPSSEKVRRDAEALLMRLQYLRVEALPSFLAMVHAAASDCGEFLEVAPTSEEVEKWFREGGE
uniref:Uncharacterized protein n=1 Tax=Thermofilum pendens TaxID=2269 RepID=A0A7J3X5D4_THEPE